MQMLFRKFPPSIKTFFGLGKRLLNPKFLTKLLLNVVRFAFFTQHKIS